VACGPKQWYAARRLVVQRFRVAAEEMLACGESMMHVNDEGTVATVQVPLSPSSLAKAATTIRSAVTVLQLLDGRATQMIKQQATTQSNGSFE
jgi:hypothetical protein